MQSHANAQKSYFQKAPIQTLEMLTERHAKTNNTHIRIHVYDIYISTQTFVHVNTQCWRYVYFDMPQIYKRYFLD